MSSEMGCMVSNVTVRSWREKKHIIVVMYERTLKILFIKMVRSCSLLCWRSGCYHSTSNTQIRGRIFKLVPIHASVIYQIPWISIPFRENSIMLRLYCATLVKRFNVTMEVIGWTEFSPFPVSLISNDLYHVPFYWINISRNVFSL